MEICNDLNRLIYQFVEPNLGSIVDAWLTHALHTKSKARFAQEMRLHIPSCKILWLDLFLVMKKPHIALITLNVTTWVGDDRSNHTAEHHSMWHYFNVSPYERAHSPVTVDAKTVIRAVGNGLKKSTPVDLGFGHSNKFWRKPKEKAILGIPGKAVERAVLNTKFYM